MALTLSDGPGLFSIDRTDDGFELNLNGSIINLSSEHAGLLADYLAGADDDGADDESEPTEEANA